MRLTKANKFQSLEKIYQNCKKKHKVSNLNNKKTLKGKTMKVFCLNIRKPILSKNSCKKIDKS